MDQALAFSMTIGHQYSRPEQWLAWRGFGTQGLKPVSEYKGLKWCWVTPALHWLLLTKLKCLSLYSNDDHWPSLPAILTLFCQYLVLFGGFCGAGGAEEALADLHFLDVTSSEGTYMLTVRQSAQCYLFFSLSMQGLLDGTVLQLKRVLFPSLGLGTSLSSTTRGYIQYAFYQSQNPMFTYPESRVQIFQSHISNISCVHTPV